MGRNRENKAEVIADLKHLLSDAQMAVVINYQGLSVAEITNLRRRLRPAGTICKVTKNTFMRLAVEGDDNWKPMTELLSGTSAFLLVKEDIGGAYKAYQEFKKETKKTEFQGGVMQGQLLTEDQVKAIADLPSKEQLLAQVAGALNAVTVKLTRGINEVPTSLARGINEVPSSLGRVAQAIANKQEGSAA